MFDSALKYNGSLSNSELSNQVAWDWASFFVSQRFHFVFRFDRKLSRSNSNKAETREPVSRLNR